MNTIKKELQSSKTKLYIIVGVLVIASGAFRVINYTDFEQTSILFVGLPALITLLLIKYAPTPKTAYGIVFKVVTLFLLMSAILFGEGIVCILFAAPLFYGISVLIVFIYEFFKRRNNKLLSLISIPVIILLLQPLGIKSGPKESVVSVSKSYDRNISISEFNALPDFLEDYPALFKIGFPKPLGITGKGIEIGDQRHIRFESNTKGIGTLTIEIDEVSDGYISFKIIQDDTHIHHWLTWKSVKVNIDSSENESRITWTSTYTCDLGPQWYFEPLQEMVVSEMNNHLIDAYFDEY